LDKLILELASGNRKRHVPFSNLVSNSTVFIEEQYVPQDFVWKDPRNLTKDAIIELCNHIRRRQDEYGPESGFRFASYFDGKNIIEADYSTRADEKMAAVRAKQQKKKRKEKRGKQPNIDISRSVDISRSREAAPAPAAAMAMDAGACQTSTTYIPQIDPSLLAEDRNSNTNSPQPAIIDQSPNHSRGGYVDDIGMQILLENGYSNTLPVNGPMDGPPQYYVSADALDTLKRITDCREVQDKNQRLPEVLEKQKAQKPRRSDRVQSRNRSPDKSRKQRRTGVSDGDGTRGVQTRSQKVRNGRR
jgi:hypothetical protein